MKWKVKKIHMVGIGGSGMSGMAEILTANGYRVSGSDLQSTPVTRRLAKLGLSIRRGHARRFVEGADVVVYSSAIPEGHPELTEARRRKIPVIRRAEMLGELMRLKFSVGVAGTHGKTTTTSMTGAVLSEAGFDPTVIVGGVVREGDSGAVAGKGAYLVAEADEFDRSFLKMPSTIAVITNIEADHLDTYRDLTDIKEAFAGFASQVPFYGCIVACVDDPVVASLLPVFRNKRVLTYGFSPKAEVRAAARKVVSMGGSFDLIFLGKKLGRILLRVPGEHNAKNALAAAAVGLELGAPFKAVRRALESFEGVRRRFEVKGERRGVTVVDDYAHHPTEIVATLKGARETFGRRRIVAIFQPHLYSRTRDFYREFGASFFNADRVVVTDIYPAREAPLAGVTGRLVADAAEERGHPDVKFLADQEKVAGHLAQKLLPGDVVITLGAGDIWKSGERLLKVL